MKSPTITSLALVVALAGFGACGGDDTDDAPTPKARLPKAQTSALQLRAATLDDGTTRNYSVFEPEGKPTAAVFVLDSYSPTLGDARRPRGILVEAAKQAGFLVVIPNGIDDTWNIGPCCGSARLQQSKDVDYLVAVVDDIWETYKIGPDDRAVVGWAVGGIMAFHLACQHSDLFGAVAVVEGVLVTKPCEPVTGVDLLQIHQLGDATIRWGGTKAAVLLSDGPLPQVDRAFDRWLVAQRCNKPVVATEGKVTTTTASCRGKSVSLLIAIEGGNGEWPTGDSVPIDATERVLAFFDLPSGS